MSLAFPQMRKDSSAMKFRPRARHEAPHAAPLLARAPQLVELLAAGRQAALLPPKLLAATPPRIYHHYFGEGIKIASPPPIFHRR